ncbi:hypothetical protein [Saccharothrix longispora]|uniref:hypothetical protein n=1 Tax=Saccharothrix longispora TaxID=33920 RepID=UPI0028FD5972|nr:hypothetical protein [Saccharothrix longispora]MDU0292854.1 hypothetical protein [Saccharothrix longispora]
MTYDIHFHRASPTGDDTGPAIPDDPDPEPRPLDLTDEQRAAWHRLARRAAREIGAVTCEEYLYDLTMLHDGPAGHLQLDYSGDFASLHIAYHYRGQEARPIMAEAYRLGRLVEEELGLEGHDHEVGQPVRTGDPDVAAARLGGVSDWAQTNLT